MRNFILRRLLQTLPMLLLASFIIFLLFAKTPGDFIDGNITLTAARAAELKAIYGLEQPGTAMTKKQIKMNGQSAKAVRKQQTSAAVASAGCFTRP